MKKLTAEQQLFVIAMEECGELTQACSKVIRGDKITKAQIKTLTAEAGDVQCMIDLMIEL
jgi:NTP pyrophosphatase (non-canonical NTP hydrolase)